MPCKTSVTKQFVAARIAPSVIADILNNLTATVGNQAPRSQMIRVDIRHISNHLFIGTVYREHSHRPFEICVSNILPIIINQLTIIDIHFLFQLAFGILDRMNSAVIVSVIYRQQIVARHNRRHLVKHGIFYILIQSRQIRHIGFNPAHRIRT